jgi:hypothetical protein
VTIKEISQGEEHRSKGRSVQSDAIFMHGGAEKIPKIISEMLFKDAESLGKCREDSKRLRIIHSDRAIGIQILTNGTFSMHMDNVKNIERFWNCSFSGIQTYKPSLRAIFEKLGKPEYDENFIFLSFQRNDWEPTDRPFRKNIPKKLIIRLVATYGDLCQNCKERKFEHIHHIDGDGCNDSFSNLMPLCIPCHNKKHPHGYGRKSNIEIP